MKKSMAGVFTALLFLSTLTGCASAASFTCTPNMPFTKEEYQKLSALQFDGYEDMSIAEYQDKVWNLTDTADYQALLERFSGSETLYDCKDSDETAAFLFYVLDPLTGQEWKTRTFSGAVSSEYTTVADNAVLEFTVTLRIDNADNLTVGEYNAARIGMTQGLQDILQDKTDVQLQDEAYMSEAIDAETKKQIQQWSNESLYISVEYSYTPLSAADPGSSPQSVWQEQEYRGFPNGTAEDYRSLFTLKTPDYQDMSIADFNMALLCWANEDYERMERINGDIGYQDFALPLTEEERSFVMLSVNFSGVENGKYVQSNYTGRAEEDPSYNEYLPVKMQERDDSGGLCELFYQFSWHIADKKKLTVGERDRCVGGMITGIRDFWEETELDILLRMGKLEIIEKLQEIADLYSTPQLTISINTEQVSFDRVETGEDPEFTHVEDLSASYTKLTAYKTEDYAQKSIADFNKSLVGSSDALSELLEAFAEVNVPPEDENYDFFAVTLQASLNELYCEKFKEETFFHMTLSRKEDPYKEPDAYGDTVYAFWFNADAYLNYCIISPDTLTVAERDKILTTFRSEMQKYVDGLSKAEVAEGNIRKLLMDKGADLAARLSSESIILSFEVGMIEISDNAAEK